MQVSIFGALGSSVMSFFMDTLLLRQRNIQTHIEGVLCNPSLFPCFITLHGGLRWKESQTTKLFQKSSITPLRSNEICLMSQLCFLLWWINCRIVQVDLKFPSKPIVSSAAKDLISQVSFSLLNGIANSDLLDMWGYVIIPVWDVHIVSDSKPFEEWESFHWLETWKNKNLLISCLKHLRKVLKNTYDLLYNMVKWNQSKKWHAGSISHLCLGVWEWLQNSILSTQ